MIKAPLVKGGRAMGRMAGGSDKAYRIPQPPPMAISTQENGRLIAAPT